MPIHASNSSVLRIWPKYDPACRTPAGRSRYGVRPAPVADMTSSLRRPLGRKSNDRMRVLDDSFVSDAGHAARGPHQAVLRSKGQRGPIVDRVREFGFTRQRGAGCRNTWLTRLDPQRRQSQESFGSCVYAKPRRSLLQQGVTSTGDLESLRRRGRRHRRARAALRADTDGVPFIERVASREIYRNPWMVLREDDIRRPDGSAGIYAVVDKPTYALVMPYDGDRFRLVEQFRYPVGARRWEFPQGTAPDLVDTRAVRARRA